MAIANLRSSIVIKDLALRTIIGFNSWEREKKQDIVINLKMEFDPTRAVETDNVDDTLNYKAVKRDIIDLVENSRFNLLEKLTHAIVQRALNHDRVISVWVKVDKPHALRFAESVAVEMSAEKEL